MLGTSCITTRLTTRGSKLGSTNGLPQRLTFLPRKEGYRFCPGPRWGSSHHLLHIPCSESRSGAALGWFEGQGVYAGGRQSVVSSESADSGPTLLFLLQLLEWQLRDRSADRTLYCFRSRVLSTQYLGARPRFISNRGRLGGGTRVPFWNVVQQEE